MSTVQTSEELGILSPRLLLIRLRHAKTVGRGHRRFLIRNVEGNAATIQIKYYPFPCIALYISRTYAIFFRTRQPVKIIGEQKA
jgi:hypothetical protein